MRTATTATLAGLAFVVGGFFAGTLVTGDEAVAQEGTVADAPADAGRYGPRADQRRDHAHTIVGLAADYLGMTAADLAEYLREGGIISDLDGFDDKLVTALVDALSARIDEAVEAGTIDSERADELKDGLTDRVTQFVTTTHEPGPHHDGRLGDRHVRGFLAEAAEVIGIDVRELVEGLAEGKSIADVADENGMAEGALVAQLTNSARERIEEAVNRTP